MKLIAAVSENWGIGKDNGLLFRLPKDMKCFRETTSGKTVILGRKNLESFPGGKPLKNRRNIILSKNPNFKCDGAEVCGSVEEAVRLAGDDDTFVIGGETVYRQMLDFCDTCYITKVSKKAEADRFMVNLDKSDEWQLAEESEPIEDNGHIIKFCRYERV